MLLTQDTVYNGGKRIGKNEARVVKEVEEPRWTVTYLDSPLVAKGLGDDLTKNQGQGGWQEEATQVAFCLCQKNWEGWLHHCKS